jgi:hypothetical protein
LAMPPGTTWLAGFLSRSPRSSNITTRRERRGSEALDVLRCRRGGRSSRRQRRCPAIAGRRLAREGAARRDPQCTLRRHQVGGHQTHTGGCRERRQRSRGPSLRRAKLIAWPPTCDSFDRSGGS